MSCLYCWNQPKRFGKYDLYIDGKITANEIVYKSLTESGKNEKINLDEIIKSIEERLSTHFTFNDEYETYDNLQTTFEEGSLKETVIYIVKNENDSDNPDSRDKYNEYMIVTDKDGNKSLELIGSGSFTKQQSDLALEINARTTSDETLDKKIEDETSRATDAENVLTKNLTQEVTDRTNGDNILDEKIDSTKSELQKEIDDDVNVEKERAEGVESSLQIEIEKRVVKNDPFTITEGDNTTSITSDTISTTTLSGTLDAESMKNSLTAEAIQNVAPIAWEGSGKAKIDEGSNGLAVGKNAIASTNATAIGNGAEAFTRAISVGFNAKTENGTYYEVVVGSGATAKNHCSLTLGSAFAEKIDDKFVEHFTTTEGTGSITIGAGANTKNTTKTVDGVETTVESSNSITIGCKALNQGADSVVIGASATSSSSGNVVIGANTSTSGSGTEVVIGASASSIGVRGIAIGQSATVGANGLAIGSGSTANGIDSIAVGIGANITHWQTKCAIAIGADATVSDQGATVIRSTADDETYTQFYISGENTPLAKTYYPITEIQKQLVTEMVDEEQEDGTIIQVEKEVEKDVEVLVGGHALMGYIVCDSSGKLLKSGTRKLFDIFTDNTYDVSVNGENYDKTTQFIPSDVKLPTTPATLELDDEYFMNDEEEYKPLPIYPIVEPTVE